MATPSARSGPWVPDPEVLETGRGPIAEPGDLPVLWGRHGAWQVKLRWIVAPLMGIGVLVGRWIGFEFAARPILAIAAATVVYNAVFAWFFVGHKDLLRREPLYDSVLTNLQVVADYLAMFLLLHFTGGATSALAVFLIFHVIIAAIQFSPGVAYLFAVWAAGGLWFLLLGDVGGWLPSTSVELRGHSLQQDDPVHATILLLSFTAALFITAAMINSIMRRLRESFGDLARANAAVKTLMRERAEFMLEVAHNMRAPLSASLSMLELVGDESLGAINERQRDYVTRIGVRLRSLHRLIGELLTIGRARDWSREIPDVVVEVAELAAYTKRTFADQAAAKGIDFRVVCEPDPPKVDSGADLLERLMENLVSNAIKYTPEQGQVEVRFERRGDEGVRIVVRDTGIGIPAAEQGRLFREFFRASNARKHTREGTGLGLTLVKQTVERHRGRLELSSDEGRGTEIVIDLPIHRDVATVI